MNLKLENLIEVLVNLTILHQLKIHQITLNYYSYYFE